jgi:chaperone required for assembly of F1-ATPase
MKAKGPPAPSVYTAVSTPYGCAIIRDGTAFKTPGDQSFVVPTLALGMAIVSEWRVQSKTINPSAMPMTQLAFTTLDIIDHARATKLDQIATYAASELLCHRAQTPAELTALQDKVWQPLLDWCDHTFHALLQVGVGILPITQLPQTLQTLHTHINAYESFRLTGLQQAIEISGSFVVGLALAEGFLTAEEAFAAAELDTLFQIQRWGADPATLARHASIKRDLQTCATWFALLSA